ncbi:hypothetical protein BDV59DRAFT_104749 [Aspergillus ambiguus]|uniref:uncharacterized protein n=1 Tax=Aspergillus ambiguus TaxID=176160 RepID=UPI003CCD1663
MEEAVKLLDPTRPHDKVPDHYVVQRDVFHELHCLNRLRLGLYGRDAALLEPDNSQMVAHFNETDLSIEHLDHCIDTICQSLMCSADISVVSWKWDTKAHRSFPIKSSTHTCRDSETVQE